jgi:predicted Zn-dependent protease
MRRAFFVCFLCCWAGVSWASDLPSSSKVGSMDDAEKRLWLRSTEEEKILDESGFLYRDEKLQDYLTRIAEKLRPEEAPDRLSFKVRIIKNPYLNAFAFPNGVLYVHTGILARMDNEAQLAALLAHEMVHCIRRHALKAYMNAQERNPSHPQALAKSEGAGDPMRAFGHSEAAASMTGYSKEFEAEADTLGFSLMVKAGYDPGETLNIFKYLEEELVREKMGESFFGSHPNLQSRIKNYQTLLDSRKEEGGIKNEEIFLENLHGVLLDNASLDLMAGRFFQARQGIEKYLKVRPDDAKAYYLLGEIFRQRGEEGDPNRAKSYYEKAISLRSSYADPYKAMGLIYFKEGERRLAKRSFETCLSLSPHASDTAYVERYLKRCGK